MLKVINICCIGLAMLLSLDVAADEAANREAINKATTWLKQQQNPDGSWGADEGIRYQVTTSAVDALKYSNTYSAEYYAGVAWLENHNANNVDSISRKITSLTGHGNNLASDINNIQAAKQDGSQRGWGLSKNYLGSSLDTALALDSLSKSSIITGQDDAIAFLQATQWAGDHGWTILINTIEAIPQPQLSAQMGSDYWITAKIYSVLADIKTPTPTVTALLTSATPFLEGIPKTSNSLALSQTGLALYKRQGLAPLVDGLVTELLSRQTSQGYWKDEYTTSNSIRLLSSVLGMDTSNDSSRVSVDDQDLRAIINALLAKNAFDNLTQGEMQVLTSLDLRSSNVANLNGLEYAANLQTIMVNRNTDISAISGLAGVVVIVDSDIDGIADSTDNCPSDANANQADFDNDGLGDLCDTDKDGDGYTVAQGDTNDYDRNIHPGSVEICGDLIDQDGNGVDSVCGDINDDGVVNVADLLLIQRHINGYITLTGASLARGDLYPAAGDGLLTIQDMLLLQRTMLGLR